MAMGMVTEFVHRGSNWVKAYVHRIGLFTSLVFTSTFLLCCQNSLQSIQKEQETKLAVMHEKEKSILAECELKRLGGELKTYTESTQCSNPVITQAHQEAGDPAMNLVYLLTAYRLAIAERIDKGVLSEAEGNLMLAQLVSRINTERLQRDMAAAQQTARASQSYEALLQGLGVWQNPANPPAENNIGAPPQPESLPGRSQQAHGRPIRCYPSGPRITCQ